MMDDDVEYIWSRFQLAIAAIYFRHLWLISATIHHIPHTTDPQESNNYRDI